MSYMKNFDIKEVNLLEFELLIAKLRKWLVWIGLFIVSFFIQFNSVTNEQGITAVFAIYYSYAMEKYYLRPGNNTKIKYISTILDLVLLWSILWICVNFNYQFLGLFFINALFIAMRFALDGWPWMTINTLLFTSALYCGGYLGEIRLEILWLLLVSALGAWLTHQHKEMDERLLALYRLNHHFNSTLRAKEVMEITIRELRKVWPGCGLYIALLNETKEFSVLASSNNNNLGKLELGSFITSQLLEDREVVIIKNTLENKQLSITTLKKFYLRSLLMVPIIVRDSTIGVIIIESQKIRDFDHDEIAIIILASSQIGISLENARLYESMENLARMDELTKVYNRRAFHELTEKVFETAKNNSQVFSIILIDIDYFKHINDKWGHLTGDRILAKTAFIMKQSIRPEDLLARYGGEEFIIALPGADREIAFAIGERIRKVIEQSFLAEGLKVTISGGVVSFPEDGSNVHELIKKSDSALYMAKSRGRNQILIA